MPKTPCSVTGTLNLACTFLPSHSRWMRWLGESANCWPPTRVDGPMQSRLRKPRLLSILGPGLITGAADDDPSGIATYSQAGAQFGFRLGWTLVLTYPLMIVIQAISARIGRTTG